jgi:hypothetical protein
MLKRLRKGSKQYVKPTLKRVELPAAAIALG